MALPIQITVSYLWAMNGALCRPAPLISEVCIRCEDVSASYMVTPGCIAPRDRTKHARSLVELCASKPICIHCAKELGHTARPRQVRKGPNSLRSRVFITEG